MSDAPRLRNPSIVQPSPLRETIRQYCPAGTDGFVAEDLDLVVRWHGYRNTNYGQLLDDQGRFRFVEVKHGTAPLAPAQKITFRAIAQQLGLSSDRFDGYFLVQFDHQNVTPAEGNEASEQCPTCGNHNLSGYVLSPDSRITVTGSETHELSRDEFLEWLKQPFSQIPPMWVPRSNGRAA